MKCCYTSYCGLTRDRIRMSNHVKYNSFDLIIQKAVCEQLILGIWGISRSLRRSRNKLVGNRNTKSKRTGKMPAVTLIHIHSFRETTLEKTLSHRPTKPLSTVLNRKLL